MGDLSALLAAKKYVEPPKRITRLNEEEQEDLKSAFDLFSKEGRLTENRLPYFLRAMGINATDEVVDDFLQAAEEIDARIEDEDDRNGIVTLDQAWELLETILPDPASEEYFLTLMNGLNTEHFTGWMYTEDVKEIFMAPTNFPPEKKLGKKDWKEIFQTGDPMNKNKFSFAPLANKLAG